jgi:hypothetical protein
VFSYEIQQDRRQQLQREADAWRLVRDARAARAAERRAHRNEARTASRTAARTDAEGAAAPDAAVPEAVVAVPGAAASPGGAGTPRRPLGRVRRAPHARGAA